MWDTCLGSYYGHGYLTARGLKSKLMNGDRHHVSFVYDHPGAYFESIMKRIKGSLINYKMPYSGAMDWK